MTIFLGCILKDGVFLAADSRRTDLSTNQPWGDAVKKIHKVNNNVYAFTGGLGTYGHSARERVELLINDSYDIPKIAEVVSSVFPNEFLMSKVMDPDHKVSLYVGLVGSDTGSGEGCIWMMDNKNNYSNATIVTKAGTIFCSGLDSSKKHKRAEEIFNHMKTESGIQLDSWAYEVIKEFSISDTSIGFPIQLVLQRKTEVEKFPVSLIDFIPDNKFFVDHELLGKEA